MCLSRRVMAKGEIACHVGAIFLVPQCFHKFFAPACLTGFTFFVLICFMIHVDIRYKLKFLPLVCYMDLDLSAKRKRCFIWEFESII